MKVAGTDELDHLITTSGYIVWDMVDELERDRHSAGAGHRDEQQ